MKSGNTRLSQRTRVYLYVLAGLAIALLMGIEYLSMMSASTNQAYQTGTVLIDQVKNVLTTNEEKEQALVDSLKEEYIAKAKAVSYIIDNNPRTETDIAELIRIATLMSIDEIHIFDETGTIYGGTVPPYYGFNFDSGEQMAYFKPMLENRALSMCQDVTPNTAEGKAMMYAICWNDAGTRMLQIGIEPRRLIQELAANEISEVVGSMPAYDGVDIVVADRMSDKILGATVSKWVGTTLTDNGIHLASRDLRGNCHFTSTVGHKASFCSASEMDSYAIVIVQDRAMVTREVPLIMTTVFFYLLAAATIIALVVRQLTRRIMEEQRNANTDAMTGFFNRRAYEDDLVALQEPPYEKNLVYASIDLNGLKAANDTYGHEAGDELIRGAAQCLRLCMGNYGKIYRVGGDEFAAILMCNPSQMERIHDDLRQIVESWSSEHGKPLAMACGCARAEDHAELSVFELAKVADSQMYEAKAKFYRESGIDRRQRGRRAPQAEK